MSGILLLSGSGLNVSCPVLLSLYLILWEWCFSGHRTITMRLSGIAKDTWVGDLCSYRPAMRVVARLWYREPCVFVAFVPLSWINLFWIAVWGHYYFIRIQVAVFDHCFKAYHFLHIHINCHFFILIVIFIYLFEITIWFETCICSKIVAELDQDVIFNYAGDDCKMAL